MPTRLGVDLASSPVSDGPVIRLGPSLASGDLRRPTLLAPDGSGTLHRRAGSAGFKRVGRSGSLGVLAAEVAALPGSTWSTTSLAYRDIGHQHANETPRVPRRTGRASSRFLPGGNQRGFAVSLLSQGRSRRSALRGSPPVASKGSWCSSVGEKNRGKDDRSRSAATRRQ